MKRHSRPHNQGSMLVVTVCVVFVIGTALVSYLWFVNSKNRLSSRSLHWNMAMAHAEAGIEEALAQLNHQFGTNVNRAANGWGGPSGGNYGPVTRTNSTGHYMVAISTDGEPFIRSTGYAVNPIRGDLIGRSVEVQAKFASAFQLGMAAKLDITFNGNYVRIDSYDSADTAHDDPLDPNEVKDNGDVASTEGLVNIGNAIVKGRVRTGPVGGYDVGPQGSAGSLSWPDNCGKIQPGWYLNDFNAEFKDVTPPFETWNAWPNLTSSNTWLFTDGDYRYAGDMAGPSLFPNNGGKIFVVASGVVRLWVTGDFIVPNTWSINVSNGATFKLYVGNISGSPVEASFGAVNSGSTTKAATFQYYGFPNNTEITWAGNDVYKGTVYAPQAVFTLSGGGSPADAFDYIGACVVYKVVINGRFNFHYDEDLKRKDPYTGYAAGSWREL